MDKILEKQVDVKDLLAFQPDNAKTQSFGERAKLKRSLEKNGVRVPLFVWRNGEKSYVIDGHHRLELCRELEIEKVPCLLVDFPSKEKAKEFYAFLNSKFSKLDKAGYADFLSDLKLDFDTDFNFNISSLKPVTKAVSTSFNDFKFNSKNLGKYSLLEGDCLLRLKEIPTGSCSVLITDPPYSSGGTLIASRSKSTGSKYVGASAEKRSKYNLDFVGDTMGDYAFINFAISWISECARILENGLAYIFIDDKMLPYLMIAFQSAGFSFKNVLVWDKGMGRIMKNGYCRDCELVVFGQVGEGVAMEKAAYIESSILHYKTIAAQNRYHIAEKPTDLLRFLISNFSMGDNRAILDPFAGGGSSMEAACALGKNIYMIEKMESNCKVIKERAQKCGFEKM